MAGYMVLSPLDDNKIIIIMNSSAILLVNILSKHHTFRDTIAINLKENLTVFCWSHCHG